jgi:lipopolysaccharide/colanic/teichoic acid biosynthesis glycosyltransferase
VIRASNRTAPTVDPQATLEEAPAVRRAGLSFEAFIKRTIDIVVTLLLLVLLVPLVILIALLIKAETPGPAFYGARRMGYRGREFKMLKFRKMYDGAGGPPLTASEDDRFTATGRLLAQSKLDEIPQLFNVLWGQMSLVGPRPEDPHFVAMAPQDYETILRVKPGVTGLSQLAFARETEIPVHGDRIEYYVNRLFPQKTAIDRLYALHRTTFMDLKILWWTFFAVVFKGNVAVHRETAKLSRRTPRTRPEAVAEGRGEPTTEPAAPRLRPGSTP